MIQRIYIDTSVIGGYFDPEFEEFTRPFFQRVLDDEIIVIYSNITEEELISAPEHVKQFMRDLPETAVEYVEVSDESTELAIAYLNEGVVGKSSFADCMHIALASIHRADLLVSWNFRHIVNINRIRGYNAVNYKLGYPIIDIRSPREVVKYDKE
jgi:predicted nucleic acid-binding protein